MCQYGNRIYIAFVAGILALAGCANPDATNYQPNNGAIVGGLTGVAVVDGTNGTQLRAQEREFLKSRLLQDQPDSVPFKLQDLNLAQSAPSGVSIGCYQFR